MKTDYHMHSIFSCDGHDTPQEMCERALSLGFTEIAITDHAEWHNGGDGFANVKAYLAAIDKCRQMYEPQGLRVLSGVELGNPHEFAVETAELLNNNRLDVTIGSLHYLYGIDLHTPHCFQGRDPYAVVSDYFEEVARMSATADFHILGHLDRIFVQPAKMDVRLNLEQIEPIIRTTLFTIIKRGQILEVNTKNYHYKPTWFSWQMTLLRWYHEMGGQRVVVTSDAHYKQDIGRDFELAADILVLTGFDGVQRIEAHMEVDKVGSEVASAVW